MICAGAISWLYIPALIAGVYFDIPVSALRLQAAKIVMMNVFHFDVELEDYIIAGGDWASEMDVCLLEMRKQVNLPFVVQNVLQLW